jgi:hypothetical protein
VNGRRLGELNSQEPRLLLQDLQGLRHCRQSWGHELLLLLQGVGEPRRHGLVVLDVHQVWQLLLLLGVLRSASVGWCRPPLLAGVPVWCAPCRFNTAQRQGYNYNMA